MEAYYLLEREQRIALTRRAREQGVPVMALWADLPEGLGQIWERRTALAGSWLAGAAAVADVGCGTMDLERWLEPSQHYHAVDVVPRDARTLVLNLNDPADLERLPAADACALLGVLEYCYKPELLFANLRPTYPRIVMSFNVLDEDRPLESRLEHGWVNHFTFRELAALWSRHGFAAVRDHRFEGRRREYLFELVRIDV